MSNVGMPIIDEESTYRKALRDWSGKINTTVNRWAIPGVIGCTHDDFIAVSRLSLLKALRVYNPTTARFSTLFYTLLHRDFCTAYNRAGLVRTAYRVRLLHKRTHESTVISKKFETHEEALYAASSIGGRRSSVVVREVENRHKRIPPSLFVLNAPLPTHSGYDDDGQENVQVIDRVPAYDRRRFDLSKIITLANRRLKDERERQYVQLLVVGNSPEICRRTVHYTRLEAQTKLKKFRRVAIDVMKELVA